MSSEALREAKVWLEQLASADRELVRTSGLAAALLAEVARLEQELSLLDRNATVWHADDCGVHNENPPWRCTCDGNVLRDELAVAREREQRAHVGYLREIDAIAERYERREEIMREALQRIADENYLRGSNDGWEGMCARQGRLARAALVDEPAAAADEPTWDGDGFEQPPAAATLAEPGRRDANGPAVVLGEASLPGSASAAADEPGETPA